MKTIMFYCQHVLGMGHMIRSLEIVRALTDYDVYFLNGGELLSDVSVPPPVHIINLPPLKSDAEFEGLSGADSEQPVEEIIKARRALMLQAYGRIQPDLLILELFPFGRKRFACELVPLLARVRLSGGQTKVVCSLRDILVSKSDQTRHEEWVVALMNRYFDLLLVHADPDFQTLEETFSLVPALTCNIHYTGFVSQTASASHPQSLLDIPASPEESPIIIASIGGGRVGSELMECIIIASDLLTSSFPHRLIMFAGPYMSDEDYRNLQQRCRNKPYIVLQRYTNRFLAYLTYADLSISMAGYNTCMNIISTGIRALVLPFMGRGNEEQRIRAKKLQKRGIVTILDPDKLQPAYLAKTIRDTLDTEASLPRSLPDIQGAKNIPLLLDGLIEWSKAAAPFVQKTLDWHADSRSEWQDHLRRGLEGLAETRQTVHVFLRDDDIDDDEESLRHLWDITLSYDVPLNLQIIPEKLTPGGIRFLKDCNRISSALVSLNQHGLSHHNHENVGRKCEFGPSRSFQEQMHDIAKGKTILESIFPIRFFPVFTPPWNRCTTDTFQVLDELGFHILSKDNGKPPVTGYSFTEISTTLDLCTWKGGPQLKGPEDIATCFLKQMHELDLIGILLHHKVMDTEAFLFLDQLLAELRQWPNIVFHSFQTLWQTQQRIVPLSESKASNA